MNTKAHLDLAAVARCRALARSGAARSIRIAAGVSLAEVARQLQVSPSTIHRWETGLRSPRAAAAERYGRLLRQLIEAR
ncbi:MAG: helix-turn-helix transcriptional regulator [Acidobacteria bacterium]|nr:helix-turn-helix transcriptional regulator [Acidobacteriota bacterium]